MVEIEKTLTHPWAVAFDRIAADDRAWIVGGVLLREMVPGGRDPRDLDVQFEGSAADAQILQAALRAEGIPANVRSLQERGVSDMMGFAAAWRRAKYRRGVIVADPLAVEFFEHRRAVVLASVQGADLALKSAQWVLLEYPGASIEVR
jgi:hypothetical protein